jgi:hypothetical protein
MTFLLTVWWQRWGTGVVGAEEGWGRGRVGEDRQRGKGRADEGEGGQGGTSLYQRFSFLKYKNCHFL